MQRDQWKYLLWVASAALWATVCFVIPDFLDNPIEGLSGLISLFIYICACGFGALCWVYIIGCSKYVCAVILPIFSLLGSVLAFYRIGYHTTLTPMLINITLHTNAEEAMGVISWQVILWVLLNLLIASVFVWIRWSRVTIQNGWLHCIIALVVGFGYFSFNDRLQRSLRQRFPNNIPYNISEYIHAQRAIHEERTIPTYNTITIPDSLQIVFIIGEAVRADHIQINGYTRETTPRLSLRKNIVSYPNIHCDQTHTLASLPYILTRADSIHEHPQYTETSFVSILKETGFSTSWISNQDLGNTFTPFLGECDTAIFANAGKSVYVFSQWLDEELIPILHSQMTDASRSLYILHTIGSHWYYNNHVPKEMYYYQPITTNRVATSNSTEQLINSYDNTVRYMDFFVDSIIDIFEDQNAIVIYQADHGEALGEDGYYLHANESEFAKNPACFVWYSDKYAAANPDKIKALVANKDKGYRTDYLFYSILYAAGIEAEGDNTAVNIFKQQQNHE